MAVFDGERTELVELGEQSAVMPSATYISREFQTLTGQEAIDRYIAVNVGRKVELIPEVVGKASIYTGGGGDRKLANTLETTVYSEPRLDLGLEGRLFRGTKRLLASSETKRLLVFDRPFRLIALITPQLLRMRTAIERMSIEGSVACVGHPVKFEGADDSGNCLALERLGEAFSRAGIGNHTFMAEPIAASLGFVRQNPSFGAETILTVDFGGGTLDLCVLRVVDTGQYEVIATHGLGLGGDHIDRTLFRKLLFPLLGEGESWTRRPDARTITTRFPFDMYAEPLLNWAITYLLNQNRYMTPVSDGVNSSSPRIRRKFLRLRDHIQNNYSYSVFQHLRAAKVALSTTKETQIDIPQLDIDVTLTRSQFEMLISKHLAEFENAVDTVVDMAGLSHETIDVVLRTGGSSQIPAVQRALDSRFPEKVVRHDPLTSVAQGLAVADYLGLSL